MDVTSVCWILLATCLFSIVSAVLEQIITMKPGQDVNLTCEAPNNNNIIIVEWSRADLKEDEYVLFYRDGRFLPDNQHPSFKNRVDLQDRQMKDGDVSLILNNVTINDTGTYECRVWLEETRSLELINSTNLTVVPPGQPRGDGQDGGKEAGSVGMIVGLSVFALLLVAAVVGFLMYRKHQEQKIQDSYQPPAEQQPV
ncbi:CD226 antigen-like [Oreochromis aureus]|uniref:CD226 antigen-like n=1 Tax=Oreochromis aureus TaxID=47969 RepID=UPI001954157A|nr:CD226 antigen-like [Oreochromis aureus]